MPEIYEHFHTVLDEEIDLQGHVNNVAYFEWMQSAALGHSAAQGWPGEAYLAIGSGWVARSHSIEYHRSALAEEQIVVRTWIATLSKVTSIRRYRVIRLDDEQLLAAAETKWAYIDYGTGRPTRIPAEVVRSFQVVDR